MAKKANGMLDEDSLIALIKYVLFFIYLILIFYPLNKSQFEKKYLIWKFEYVYI